jgi:hypothetical protein
MSDTDRNNQIAAKLRELADLFHGVAQGAGPAVEQPAANDPPPAKRGRPAKQETPPPEEPADTTTVVTADHPKRAELKRVANEYVAKTDRASAQKQMKLFGENSNLVPDAELAGAIKHFKNLLVNLAKSAEPEDDGSV